MHDTVKGIIENIIYIVKEYGYMLNGARIYYTKRSQPPLLIQMVDAYYTYTYDWSIVSENIDVR